MGVMIVSVNALMSVLNASATINPTAMTTTLPCSRKFLKPLITRHPPRIGCGGGTGRRRHTACRAHGGRVSEGGREHGHDTDRETERDRYPHREVNDPAAESPGGLGGLAAGPRPSRCGPSARAPGGPRAACSRRWSGETTMA